MYDFTDLNQIPHSAGSSFGLIYNTTDLEQELPGFRTLSVTGRGLISKDISTSKVPEMDGLRIDESSLPARTIDVKFLLRASSATDLRRSYEKLNRFILTKNQTTVSFRDDPGRYYIGLVTDCNVDEELTNEAIGMMRIFCSKPYQYSNTVTSSGTSVSFPVNLYTIKLLADFSFIPTESGESIQIRNSYGQSITIGPVAAGRLYDLILSDDRITIKENGIRKMTLLSIQSGVETFRIQPGTVYSLSTGGTLTARFQELRL